MCKDEKTEHQEYKVNDVTYTLVPHWNGNGFFGWDVDCWLANDDNHWHRWYQDYDKAKAEFERWRC